MNWTEVKAFFVYIYHLFYIIIFIAYCSKFAIDVVKATTGRLRPNFYAYCRPVNQTTRISILQTCTDGQLIEDYDCANEQREAFLSFVSGHAAFVSVSFGITIVSWFLGFLGPKRKKCNPQNLNQISRLDSLSSR